MSQAPRGRVALALATVWVLWGSVYLGIRLVVNEVDPFQAMAQRFLLATVVLAAIVVARRGPRGLLVDREQLAALVATGVLLLGFGNGLQALAQVHGLPSGVAALVVATVPAWAVLLRLATGDRPSPRTLGGVVLGFGGLAALVLLDRVQPEAFPLVAVLLCLGAAVSWTLGGWFQGRWRLPKDVVTIAAYQQGVAACTSAVLAVATGERFDIGYSPVGWAAMAHLVFACSVVGFLAFAWLLTHVPLSLTATHTYVNPVVAVLLGWLVLAEPIGPPVLFGGSVVVLSVVLVVRGERAAGASARDPAGTAGPTTRSLRPVVGERELDP